MRMSEATARMNLRDYVRDDDIDFAIKVLPALSFSLMSPGYVRVIFTSTKDFYSPHTAEII